MTSLPRGDEAGEKLASIQTYEVVPAEKNSLPSPNELCATEDKVVKIQVMPVDLHTPCSRGNGNLVWAGIGAWECGAAQRAGWVALGGGAAIERRGAPVSHRSGEQRYKHTPAPGDPAPRPPELA
jgi:hypothetical protein